MHVLVASLQEEACQAVRTHTPDSKYEIPVNLWLAEGKVNTGANAALFVCCFYPPPITVQPLGFRPPLIQEKVKGFPITKLLQHACVCLLPGQIT